MPSKNGEERIYAFVGRHVTTCRFAYLSCASILRWFDNKHLAILADLDFHISVFLVLRDYHASAFSSEQVVFLPDKAHWLRFMSLIDLRHNVAVTAPLTCDMLQASETE